MPTYEYACKDCGHGLEVVQKFSDDPLIVCPNCSGALRKVLHAPGISFKGTGFYKNDSRPSSGSTTPTPAVETTSDKGGDAGNASTGGKEAAKPAAADTPKAKEPAPAPAKTKAAD